MKIYFAPSSPYARKVRVLAHEAGIHERIHWIEIDPWRSEELRRINPLGKVPALLLPDGRSYCDSTLICEYLDAVSGHRAFPAVGEARWRALRLQALADGCCDALGRWQAELWQPPDRRSEAVIARQAEAVDTTAATFDGEADRFSEVPTIGEMAVACAVACLDHQRPEYHWRSQWPHLAHWYERFAERPSMRATLPPHEVS